MYKGLLVLLLLAVFACQPPANECACFKTGVFTMKANDWTYRFTRTPTEQLEENLTTGANQTLQITWHDDCTYSLVLLDSITKLPNKDRTLDVRITKTGDKYYYFESSKDGQVVMTGRLDKIK